MSAGFCLAVHGGAANLRPERLRGDERDAMLSAVRSALAAGSAVLAADGPALDAVEAAVVALEAAPVLNAGVGSVLTADGAVEMDAAIADGASGAAGAVAAVTGVAHPVRLARRVMENSPHRLLAGRGAVAFAREQGLPLVLPGDLVTEARQRELTRARESARISLDHEEAGGTVGAVARDAAGHLAAATSTGGMTNQRAGRVGDSPLLGAGTWARDATCAVSATGHGERFIDAAFAHEVDARMRLAGEPLEVACAAALARVSELGGAGGCIAIDAEGRLALPFTTRAMVRGCQRAGEPAFAAIFADA